MEWQPFDVSSDVLLSSLKHWKAANNLPSEEEDHGALVTNGNEANGHRRDDADRSMTAWESLLWSLWLPKVRSAIK
jgi:tuftelin-interacting protein 11